MNAPLDRPRHGKPPVPRSSHPPDAAGHRGRAAGRRRRCGPARGAALLVAMVVLTVVATLASGMVWQQWKAVQVEAAERGRVQSGWILNGALDWARLILREDARSGRATSLHEPWATPLAEARLSTFLASDRDHSADAGPEAFLSGRIDDAQARYNLRNLLAEGKITPARLAVLERLCTSAGLSADTAALIGNRLLAAAMADADDAPLMPQTLADLVWLGVPEASVQALSTLVVLLPVATPINLNTAPREVLAATIPGVDLGSADRLVQARGRQPLRSLAEATAVLGPGATLEAAVVDVKSSFFEVHGRLRLADRVLQEQSLVERLSNLDVLVRSRRRESILTAGLRN